MLVDGYSREEIKEILDTRIEQTYQQELSSAGIYRTMAKLAPAYGIIGTLIGLIGMMQSMSVGLGNLGAHMAVALTTTLHLSIGQLMPFLPDALKDINIGFLALAVNIIVFALVSAVTQPRPAEQTHASVH